MVLLSDVGGVTGVMQTLTSVSVPAEVINQIVSLLEENSTYLKGGQSQFQAPQETWFGGTYGAHNLGVHTVKAHEKLFNSVLEAVSSLQATGAAMEDFDREMSSADANSQDATRALLNRTQQAIDSMDDNRYTPPVSHGDGTGRGR